MSTKKEEGTVSVTIKAPNFKIAVFKITGTAPFVMHKFSATSRNTIIDSQKAGTVAKGKKVRAPKDFDKLYEDCFHRSKEGWAGIHAGAFRNAMISACRTVGYKMTHAKLAAFILQDGFDAEDGTPLVRIDGKPERHTTHARNDSGGIDIRVRPMWREWAATVRIRFDADMFSEIDVANLMMRVGMQVGIGEGRPDSKSSAGMGWGMFTIEDKAFKPAPITVRELETA